MTDLENFSSHALEHDGIWHVLESRKYGSMYETQACYTDGSREYHTAPVYHVYDGEGNRKLTTMNCGEAYRCYRRIQDENM